MGLYRIIRLNFDDALGKSRDEFDIDHSMQINNFLN